MNSHNSDCCSETLIVTDKTTPHASKADGQDDATESVAGELDAAFPESLSPIDAYLADDAESHAAELAADTVAPSDQYLYYVRQYFVAEII